MVVQALEEFLARALLASRYRRITELLAGSTSVARPRPTRPAPCWRVGHAQPLRPRASHLRTPGTFLGYGRSGPSRHRTAPRSTDGAPTSSPSACASTTGPSRVVGEWTVGRENVVLDRAGGSIAYRFHAGDAHLVLSPGSAPADFLPRARRRRGSGPVPSWTSRRTATACSGPAACTSSYASTTRPTNEPWRSRCSSPAPRRTCSRSGSQRWRHTCSGRRPEGEGLEYLEQVEATIERSRQYSDRCGQPGETTMCMTSAM